MNIKCVRYFVNYKTFPLSILNESQFSRYVCIIWKNGVSRMFQTIRVGERWFPMEFFMEKCKRGGEKRFRRRSCEKGKSRYRRPLEPENSIAVFSAAFLLVEPSRKYGREESWQSHRVTRKFNFRCLIVIFVKIVQIFGKINFKLARKRIIFSYLLLSWKFYIVKLNFLFENTFSIFFRLFHPEFLFQQFVSNFRFQHFHFPSNIIQISSLQLWQFLFGNFLSDQHFFFISLPIFPLKIYFRLFVLDFPAKRFPRLYWLGN